MAKNVRIIIINGYPGAGKDTFIDFCNVLVPVENLHTSDPAKMALKRLGWNGIDKTPEVRATLAEFKQISSQLFDGTVKYLDSKIYDVKQFFAPKDWVVFIHSREPEEIQRLVERYSAKTLFISRKVDEEDLHCEADRNVENYNYDLYIDNNGTLQELKDAAEGFVNKYILGGLW